MFAPTKLRRRGAEGQDVDRAGAAQNHAPDEASAPHHWPDDISTHLDDVSGASTKGVMAAAVAVDVLDEARESLSAARYRQSTLTAVC